MVPAKWLSASPQRRRAQDLRLRPTGVVEVSASVALQLQAEARTIGRHAVSIQP
jgi:hypothetical protein